jgi:urea transport system ATP-binding protein
MMNVAPSTDSPPQVAQGGSKDTGISDGHVVTDEVDVSHRGILYLDSISVAFDGFKALNDLSLIVDAGELRCVIGPNGAGKTTMMDVITGKTRPDSGTAYFGQTIDLTELTEPEIAGRGIGRKFQKPTVFERHSVFENLELARKADKRVWPTLRAQLDSTARDRILTILETIQLAPEARAWPAPVARPEQWLEIGMLLMQEPQVLLLDEPVAGMTDDETMRSAELFLTLAGDYTLVVVEHDMDFVAKIADRVTVLHEGRVLAEGSMKVVQENEQVIEVFLGR